MTEVDRHAPPATAVAPQFDVVAIGASAGGVEALHVVVSALPAALPATVLVVQHMDPRHKIMLAGLLARRSRLAGLLPEATLVVIPGGGHMFASDRATEVAPHVARHLFGVA